MRNEAPPVQSWADYFRAEDDPELDEVNNDLSQYFHSTIPGTPPSEVCHTLAAYNKGAFIYAIKDEQNHVSLQLVHHIMKKTSLANKTTDDEVLFGIKGLLADAPIVEVTNEFFTVDNQPAIKTPSVPDLLQVETETDMKNLKAPADDSGDSFIPTIGVPVVPFMIPIFEKNSSIDLLMIFSDLKDAINIFASTNTDHPTISEDCRRVLQFVWALLQEPPIAPVIEPANVTTSNDNIIAHKVSKLKKATFTTLATDAGPLVPGSTIPDSSGDVRGLMQLQYRTSALLLEQMKKTNDENKTTKSWKARLNDRSSQMILFASIPKDSDAVPDTPNKDYQDFLESPKHSA